MTNKEIQELQVMSSEIQDIEMILRITGEDANTQFKIRCRRKRKEGSIESGTYTISPSLSRFIIASLRSKGEELKTKLANLKIISEDETKQPEVLTPNENLTPSPIPEPEEVVV